MTRNLSSAPYVGCPLFSALLRLGVMRHLQPRCTRAPGSGKCEVTSCLLPSWQCARTGRAHPGESERSHDRNLCAMRLSGFEWPEPACQQLASAARASCVFPAGMSWHRPRIYMPGGRARTSGVRTPEAGVSRVAGRLFFWADTACILGADLGMTDLGFVTPARTEGSEASKVRAIRSVSVSSSTCSNLFGFRSPQQQKMLGHSAAGNAYRRFVQSFHLGHFGFATACSHACSATEISKLQL